MKPMGSLYVLGILIIWSQAGPVPAAAEPIARPGPEALETSFRSAQRILRTDPSLPAVLPEAAAPPVGPAQPAVVSPDAWSTLPAPDAATLAWLARRVPGLDLQKVRSVPPAKAQAVLQRAVSRRLTYLDLLTDESFRRDEIYFVPADVLAGIDQKYVTGAVPISGKAKDKKPFRMEGFLGGQGRLEILYDRQGAFEFKEDANWFKVDNGSRVSCRILAPADVAVEGMSVWADLSVFGFYTKIERMVKEGADKARVYTAAGNGTGDLRPIRSK